MVKCIDKINALSKEGKPFFSFEYFPPKTDDGVDNLFERMDRMVSYGPSFCDITWGAGGSTADLTLDIADRMQNEVHAECMMHLTCTNMPEAKLKEALASLKKSGVKNILALRGDPPHGQDKFEAVEGGFSCALDLIKYIRKETGDHFGIGVSGYPEAHPDVIVEDKSQMEKNYWSDIQYLKEKMDAGADFVVTQLFYDADLFIKFVKDCRSVGINAPILPGIMPIMAYGGFNRMTTFCKTYVPPAIREKVESLKDDEAGLKEYGIQLGVDICRTILDSGTSPGVHMYSLNQDKSVVAILERLGLLDTQNVPRALPFRPRSKQRSEAVRPVYWINRSKAYVQRTQHWERVPEHAWAEASGQEFGAAEGKIMSHHVSSEKRKEKATAAWGSAESLDSIKEVFTKVVSGEDVPFPWAEAALSKDMRSLAQPLQRMIQQGMLPINALPVVNAKASSDKTHGWGPRGGFIYQKGYVEFFCSPDAFKNFVDEVSQHQTMTFMAAQKTGDVLADCAGATCVTWGVFAQREIAQPLAVCPSAFKAWRDEAFALWNEQWGAVASDAGKKQLQDICDLWYLVSVLENNFVSGDVFSFLKQ